ncbi:MAG: hypothetical protein KDB27_10285 [Planctomycetales bacterium]|nr:hypothetical protein [Planctomycetales bacterium]
MMTTTLRRFAANALLVFFIGALAIMFLEVAESQGVISLLTESAARFAVWAVLVALLLASSCSLPSSSRFALCFCVTFLLLDFMFDVIEEIHYFDDVPFIGHDSRWRHALEKTLVSCWGCGALYLMYLLIRDLDSSFSELELQATEKEKLNQQLRQTINELNDA